MYVEAESFLEEIGLELEVVKSLAEETTTKSFFLGPKNSQTGPALRGDTDIMEKHIKLLEGRPSQELYKLLSKRISEHMNPQ